MANDDDDDDDDDDSCVPPCGVTTKTHDERLEKNRRQRTRENRLQHSSRVRQKIS